MRGAGLLLPSALVLTIMLTGCSATKPVTQAVVAAPAATTDTTVTVNQARATTTQAVTVAAVPPAAEDEAIQLALRQQAEDYRKQVAEDVVKVAMVKGTRFMMNKALDRAGANPLAKFVAKAAMDDVEKQVAADMKTAEGAAVMDMASVVVRARNNNARLGKMVVTVNLLVDQRRKDTVRIKVASVEERKRFATRLDADEALLAMALAASEEEERKIRQASEKDAANKDLVIELETTRKQGLRIKEAMVVVKSMRKVAR